MHLKQLVESTLKVLRKSLKTGMDEVYFIANLQNFILPLFFLAYHSFPKVSHLPPFHAE